MPKFRLPLKFRDLLHAAKSTTWDRRLYFPSEGRRAEDFFDLQIVFHISRLFENKTVAFARRAYLRQRANNRPVAVFNQCVHVTTLHAALLYRITPAAEPQMRLLTNYHVWKHLFRHERRRTHRNTVCVVCQGQQNSFVITPCLNSW